MKCCKKAGNFLKKPHSTDRKQMYNTTTAENKFWDDGNFMQKGNAHMLSAVNSEAQKELLVQFAIGKELHSIDQKVILKLDTSMDVTYLNMKTFRTLF